MLRGAALLLLLVSCVSACTVSFTAFAINDTAYKSVWASHWSNVINSSVPWRPSATGPGVCNVGGSQQGCYATDQAVIVSLSALRNGLRTTDVPKQYARANTETMAAVTLAIVGLHDRNAALVSGSTTTFTKANGELARASRLFAAAYAAFPADDRPGPAPFG